MTRAIGFLGGRRRALPCALFLLAAILVRTAAATYDPTEEIARVRASIAAHGSHWTAGVTSVNSVPPEERGCWMGEPPPSPSGAPPAGNGGARDLPAAWDWRQHGGVTPARDQHQCGSCWVFAAVGLLESAVMVDCGRSLDLSEQQVLACNDQGCGCLVGCRFESAIEVFSQHASVLETCLPYVADDDVPCVYDCQFGAYAEGVRLISGDPENLKRSVLKRPVAVGMDVYPGFGSYTGGCLEHNDGAPRWHDLLLVGWDDNACDGAGAWICKNSWGPQWGIDGFCYVRYGECRLGADAYEILFTHNLPIFLRHEPVADQFDPTGPAPVLCNLAARDFRLDRVASRVRYRCDEDSIWKSVGLTLVPGETPGTYQAGIPLPSVPAVIDYYLDIVDQGGNRRTDPADAPVELYTFHVGYTRILYAEDVEGDHAGWTLGAPGDDATDGQWEAGIPHGTEGAYHYPCNPPYDHTPEPGCCCFCTGLAAGLGPMDNDVDGGKTTLISPRIEVSDVTAACVEYYRWFSNGAEPHPDYDYWQVDVSDDDGATWVPLEYTNQDDPMWRPYSFALEGRIALTDSVRVRFIASDYGQPSIVEAAVDDFRVRATDWTVQGVAAEDPSARALRLRGWPNPTSAGTTLRLVLPARRDAQLRVHGPDGRLLRRLSLGALGPGPCAVAWDGRDDHDRPVPAGVYWIRLTTGAESGAARVIVVR
jgi:hypothetical protein